jgi:AcrR family transcriptional regulator
MIETEPQRRAGRAEQILTVAGELLLRWGYRRITMEEIAQRAGVGTGTLYLHWRTKEALFETVLLRELLALWTELAERLRADPAEALLHRLLSSLLRAVKERPLARALFTRDPALLGKLAQGDLVRQNQQFGADALLPLCRELGLMRRDAGAEAQAYAFSAIWTGFIFVEQLLAERDRAALEAQLDALTLTIRRVFEPDAPPTADELRSVAAPALLAVLGQACAACERAIELRTVPPRGAP